MARETGLRDRKKAQTRHRLADVAARLFAEHGYDAVSVVDVARAADVSDQTVYNYFTAKQDLVLDRADEIRELYGRVVHERAAGSSPATALRQLVADDIARYRQADPTIARGEFPAQCLESPTLRRFALETRELQVLAITEAILTSIPELHPLSVKAHAAALISVIQTITDLIGESMLANGPTDGAAAAMSRDADIAFDELDRAFTSLVTATAAAAAAQTVTAPTDAAQTATT
ncbi:TetR/AcrR family transcriptional regulator [Plantibacter sp. YIM 135249]|uniref:TetR/AcrR family transcriptional regulator n=1 Tax=Plantibacter sp. YIM 135249 TaxID=3423918 RepID=UPI003D34F65A